MGCVKISRKFQVQIIIGGNISSHFILNFVIRNIYDNFFLVNKFCYLYDISFVMV